MKRNSFIFYIVAIGLFFCNALQAADPIMHPILREPTTLVNLHSPKEQRGERYVNFLCVSVKISVSGASGSGTICHYDSSSGWAYVISCGHLWEGEKSYVPGRPDKAIITAWYHNDKKLGEPKTYEAESLFWSNKRGQDTSLVRFKPDWIPKYAPIALSFNEKEGSILNSMGCDGGKEVARYEVRFSSMSPPDLITALNSPRPGRSGGGLLTNQGEIVGICWGTSDTSSGNGIGYFTPLSSIRIVLSKNNHEWLINNRRDVESIMIIDWDLPGRKYDRYYVPVPNLQF